MYEFCPSMSHAISVLFMFRRVNIFGLSPALSLDASFKNTFSMMVGGQGEGERVRDGEGGREESE